MNRATGSHFQMRDTDDTAVRSARPSTNRVSQFIIIWVVALAITASLSHIAVRKLGIKANAASYRVFGSQDGKPETIIHGSSPAFDDLDWNQVSALGGGGIENWAIAGSSPCEWEMMQNRSPNDARTFIVVTPVDLNDYFLCDFRAELVPFFKTVQELRESGADWAFSERTLKQYPLYFVRLLFPTAGRSDGVMVGFRRDLERMIGRARPADIDRVALFGGTGPNTNTDRLTNLDSARIQRRLSVMEAGCEHKQWYGGPKKCALLRLAQNARAHGKVILVVLPLSPLLQKRFMTAEAYREFEQCLADMEASCAGMPVIRMDHLPELNHDDLFWDFVHLNMYGQQIATKEFIKAVKSL